LKYKAFQYFRYYTAQAELDQVMDSLKGKQQQLNELEKKISVLQENFESVMREKLELEDSMKLTALRLKRAGRLTKVLASEKTRWAELVEVYD